jgi:UDPglucose--hexose-1-phosphate uridylyltransferase
VSELRWNPLLEQWVITATHRQDRTFLPPADYCPLCPTRPGGFPTEVPSETYDIVVFENRFPSLQPAAPPPAVDATALSPVRPAAGICEVVLYSPRHDDALSTMPLSRIQNRGEEVGVTLHHPHGQIYAFPFLPPVPAKELAASRAYRARTGRCLVCDEAAGERADGRRIVLEGERFVAYVPFAARFPYETHVVARAHQPSMASWTAADVDDLAAVLKGVLVKFDALFDRSFPYVMVVHQAPPRGADPGEWHLHLELYPPLRSASRLKFLAGCELGAGTFINDTLPEETAAELRRVGPPTVAALREADRR